MKFQLTNSISKVNNLSRNIREIFAGIKTFSSTIAGSITVNAATATTATKLLTARTINDVSFDGSANIIAPTNLSVSLGASVGPIINSSSGFNVVIPSASATASGVVTTGAQTFAGDKIFTGQVVLSSSASTNYNTDFYKASYFANGTTDGLFSTALARYAWPQEGKVLMDVNGDASSTVTPSSYKTSLIAHYAIGAPAFIAFSDKRIKENITPLNNSLDIINKLNPVSYTKKDKVAYGGKVETGFIAQEVKEILQ